ncbi:hypothetical protein GCK72_024208 [Caenorhabditis remanei]|uniref:Uncharacterized protein n=1 Tax=Caenorhabditis remanei TaxID=31234 RepID=A0A6A5FZ64_CAERE|nr:hypothetical protein GCK72_024208 [Caenorhabditis remanei]KAF1747742.1 hypothetical protein GCK72_024208 [Caenorhabditis remanei]
MTLKKKSNEEYRREWNEVTKLVYNRFQICLFLGSSTWVVLLEGALRDTFKHFTWEDTEELPSDVKRFEDGTVLVVSCKSLLEFDEEFKVEQIIRRQGFLSDDSLHGLYVLSDSVTSVELVRNIRMVFSCHALSNSGLHETGKRWEYVEWWVDKTIVELTIDVDLSLSNVSSQIWDRARNSAAVKAIRGVMIRSMVGSLAKLRKRHTFSMDPFSSKSCLKKRAVSMLTPIAAKTIAKLVCSCGLPGS